jgi:hypothetical protein
MSGLLVAKAGIAAGITNPYTLRLLTLDQLARAAGLVCALELERARDAARSLHARLQNGTARIAQ